MVEVPNYGGSKSEVAPEKFKEQSTLVQAFQFQAPTYGCSSLPQMLVLERRTPQQSRNDGEASVSPTLPSRLYRRSWSDGGTSETSTSSLRVDGRR